MTRTQRKRLFQARVAARAARRDYARLHGQQPAAELLRNEAQRLRSLQPIGTPQAQQHIEQMAWSLAFAGHWLEARNDPAMIQQWQEITPKRARAHA